jgi:hypothetical protein
MVPLIAGKLVPSNKTIYSLRSADAGRPGTDGPVRRGAHFVALPSPMPVVAAAGVMAGASLV